MLDREFEEVENKIVKHIYNTFHMSPILLRIRVFHRDKFTCEISLKFRFQSEYKLMGGRNRYLTLR